MKCWVRDNVSPGRSRRGSRSRGTSPMPGVSDTLPLGVTPEIQQSMETACRVRKASPSTDIISCLCTAIQNSGALHKCLGVLASTDNKKHRLWIPERPECIHLSYSVKAVTLAQMLCLPPPLRKERLKLGVKLASSVMQLHKTQWLGERWSNQDIRFIIPAETHTSISPVIDSPFLHRSFAPPNPPLPENTTPAVIFPCNQSLYSLGIVLIELWHWKDLQIQGSASTGLGTGQDSDARTEYFIASQLAKELHDEAGEIYGEAVRRCIQGLDTRETSLEKDEFKNRVYSEIIRPLEEHLEGFIGKPIGDIFDKGAL